jgi:peptidoglycan/xylan/chitin deacetylase (PgdA/CDA1 family)
MINPGDYIPRRVRPPVLLYHRIARTSDPGDPLCVSPEQFEAQMRYLVEMGFTTHGLSDGVGARKPVVLTFDDGYLDTYSTAFAILDRYRLTATVFLVTGSIGGTTGEWGPPVPVPLMTWAHVEEMARHGISFQSHTRTHPDLVQCSDAAALAELLESRAEIEDHIGTEVDALAYPFGRYDPRVVALTEQARYRSAWAAGLAIPGPLSRERFQISSKDTMSSFVVKASGWGAWLRRARDAARFRGGIRSASTAHARWVGPKPC